VPAPFWQLLTLFIGIAETMRARKGWVEPSPGNVFKLRPEYKPGAARSALSARGYALRARSCTVCSCTGVHSSAKTVCSCTVLAELVRVQLFLHSGDLGWDPLQLYPLEAAGAKDMQTRELNNGRLGAQHAPIAFVVYARAWLCIYAG
jgi:hypothetical protein